MSKFTPEQKKAFLLLSEQYDEKVYSIIKRGEPDEICVESKEEAVILENFSNKICALVVKDYPDHTGKDEDINADAELIVHMISDVIADSGFAI